MDGYGWEKAAGGLLNAKARNIISYFTLWVRFPKIA